MASRFVIFVAGDGENSIRPKTDDEYIQELEWENKFYRESLVIIEATFREFGLSRAAKSVEKILAAKMPERETKTND